MARVRPPGCWIGVPPGPVALRSQEWGRVRASAAGRNGRRARPPTGRSWMPGRGRNGGSARRWENRRLPRPVPRGKSLAGASGAGRSGRARSCRMCVRVRSPVRGVWPGSAPRAGTVGARRSGRMPTASARRPRRASAHRGRSWSVVSSRSTARVRLRRAPVRAATAWTSFSPRAGTPPPPVAGRRSGSAGSTVCSRSPAAPASGDVVVGLQNRRSEETVSGMGLIESRARR